MNKLLGGVGATLGSSVGWWAGARVGVMTAVVASALGTAAGLYFGRWAPSGSWIRRLETTALGLDPEAT